MRSGSFIGGDWLDRLRTVVKRGALPGDYRAVFDSDAGRRVLHDIARESGLMVTHGGMTNEALQFEEGKRYIGLYIAGMLRLEPPDLQRLADRETIDD